MKHIETNVLISADDLSQRIAVLGSEISKDYAEKDLLLLCVLKGALPFTADLCRHISIPLQLDVIQASSYGGGTQSSGTVEIGQSPRISVTGKDVLLVEDIVDTGFTAKALIQILGDRGANTVELCTLLDKPSRRATQVPIRYVGFTIPNEFVVGYGLDYEEYYRNLPFVGIIDPKQL